MVTIWRPEKTVDLLWRFLNHSSEESRNFTECVSGLYTTLDTSNITELTYQDCLDQYFPRQSSRDLPWWIKLVWSCAFAFLVIVATVGNLIVLWIILGHSKMRTVTNYFFLSLCVADLLLAVFNAAFNFVFMLNRHWPFGRGYCIFSNFVANLSVASSVLTISSMSIDRYVAVVHPLTPRITGHHLLMVIFVVWLVGILLSLPPLLLSTTQTYKYADGSYRTLCILLWPDGLSGLSRSDYMYNVIFLMLTFVIPMVTMGVTYSRMGHVLWRGQAIGEVTEQQQEAVRSKQKIVKMLVIMVLLFAVCWLPYHVYFLYAFHHKEVIKTPYVQHVYLLFYWLAMSHSMYNPLVYYWMNGRFRSYFRQVLCCQRHLPSRARTQDSRYGKNAARNSYLSCKAAKEVSRIVEYTLSTEVNHISGNTVHQ